MKPTKTRWVPFGAPVTAAEDAALSRLCDVLPDDAVSHGWTNLTFTDLDGRIHEIDALILTKVGVFVVELKGWHGTITGTQQTWTHTTPGGTVRQVRNPLYLTDSKAKRLSSLLKSLVPPKSAAQIPYIGALVVLHGQGSAVHLDDTAASGVLALDGYGITSRPPISTLSHFLATPPARALIDGPRATAISRLIAKAGFVPTPKTRFVGQYSVEKADPLGEGPAWQDLLVSHPSLPGAKRRLRLFDIPRGASSDRRREIELAAKREFVLTQGIHHDGVVRPLEYVETDSGPALIFEHDAAARPLPDVLADEGSSWGIDERLGLIRQVAEVLRYAHHRRLTHRALSPRQIDVTLRPGAAPPRVAIRDWHAGRQNPQVAAASTPVSSTIAKGADDVRGLLAHESWVYLAPESHLGAGDLPPVPLDVYGLGAVAFLILTGEPPATTLAELQSKLEADGCLDPSGLRSELPGTLIDVVRDATRVVEAQRTASVDDVLAGLELAEEELTAPAHQDDERPAAVDPLEATKGEVIAGRFEVTARRGAGSTGTALQVDDYLTAREGLVLKVARDDGAARRLADEAEVLASLDHPRIVHLVEGPIDLDGRRALVLTDAGPETLAARLAAEGRATLEQLERFGADLLDAVAHLDARGVFHRDIKPSNLGIAPDPGTRRPHLVLFDFSLAREPVENLTSGTHGYVDPFLGRGRRRRFDRAAELCAVAVTLFEMATSERPWWAEGATAPAGAGDRVVLTRESFDPAAAPDLIDFFARALAPDATERFPDVAVMAQAWRDVFADLDTGEGGAGLDEAARDAAAEAAGLDTPLAQAGLTTRALSALARVRTTTVGELIGTSPMTINAIRGLGEQYRKEIQARVRQWRVRLLDTTTEAPGPLGGDRSVEAILRRVLERPSRHADAEILQALVGLAPPPGLNPEASLWPGEAEVAHVLGCPRARVVDALDRAAAHWPRSQVVADVIDEIVTTLRAEARIGTVAEVAGALLLRHGSTAEGPDRLRRAAGLVRVAVETDARTSTPRLVARRSANGVVLLALTPDETDDGARAVDADVALDFAQALGAEADRIVAESAITPGARARQRLRDAVPAVMDLPDERLLRLASSASTSAALSGVRELYRADLEPQVAVDHALRGVGVHTLAEAGVRRRVAARFPGLPPLPARPALDALVTQAIPGMSWDGERYARSDESSRLTGVSSMYTRVQTATWAEVDARLRASLRSNAALTLCAHPRAYRQAASNLARDYGVEAIDVASELVRAVKATATSRRVNWELVLRTDAEPNSGADWSRLLQLVKLAWGERWKSLAADHRPILLINAAPLARYGMADLLSALLDQSEPRPAARWLLVPRKASAVAPTLDGHPVPMGPDRWIDLPVEVAPLATAAGERG